MRGILGKALEIAKNDGVIVFVARFRKYVLVRLRRFFTPRNKKNLKKWKSLKGKFYGQRVFILGNGPSLNKMPLYLLKNEHSMCFNRFNLFFDRLPWLPTFYMITDDLVVKDMHEDVNKITQQADYCFFPDLHPSNVDFRDYVVERDNVCWLNMDHPDFTLELPKCGINKTVVNGALQVLAYLGFREIYLIGVDMTFVHHVVDKKNSRDWTATDDDDPNHFDPRYFGKNTTYHNPSKDAIMERFAVAKEFFDSTGAKIYNAGYGGELEIFDRTPFDQLFDYSEAETFNLFLDSFPIKFKAKNFSELCDELEELELTNDKPYLILDTEEATKQIPGLIIDYLPIGPYKGKYVFLQRSQFEEETESIRGTR